jgi:hypothetical protein
VSNTHQKRPKNPATVKIPTKVERKYKIFQAKDFLNRKFCFLEKILPPRKLNFHLWDFVKANNDFCLTI